MTEEVTIMEIMDKYMISSGKKLSTGFTKFILLNNGSNQYSGKLHWDSNNEYSITWDSQKPPEADRPDFEYILDCITDLEKWED